MRKEVWHAKYDPESKLYVFRRRGVMIIADRYEVGLTSVDLYFGGILVGYISTVFNRIVWLDGRELE